MGWESRTHFEHCRSLVRGRSFNVLRGERCLGVEGGR
jgi:hypothetical protein